MDRDPPKWIAGNLLLAAGLLLLITDRILLSLNPLKWGGPNIGRGALILLALGAVLAGIVLLTYEGFGRLTARRAARRGTAEDQKTPREKSRAWRLYPLPVQGVLVIGLVAAIVLLDDSGADPRGVIGITVDASRSPVVIVKVCRGSVDTVTVYGPNRGDEPNEKLAELKPPQPISEPFEVNLTAPPQAWAGSTLTLPLPTAAEAPIIVSARGSKTRLRQATITGEELASISPREVQLATSGTEPGRLMSARIPKERFLRTPCQELLDP